MCMGRGGVGSFRYALVGGHPHGDVGGKLTRSSTSYVIGFRNIFGLLCLVLRSRIKKIGKQAIIDQVLTILGQFLERYGFASWTG